MVEELRGWLSNRLSCGHTRGGSPIVSGAGRRTGLGAGQRMMLGSITRSFRPPTITRCSILSRRTRMTLRFPSTGRVSITATRAGALRRRSQLSMCFLPHSECRSGKQFGDVWQTCRCRRCSQGGTAAAPRQARRPDLADTRDDLLSAAPLTCKLVLTSDGGEHHSRRQI